MTLFLHYRKFSKSEVQNDILNWIFLTAADKIKITKLRHTEHSVTVKDPCELLLSIVYVVLETYVFFSCVRQLAFYIDKASLIMWSLFTH